MMCWYYAFHTVRLITISSDKCRYFGLHIFMVCLKFNVTGFAVSATNDSVAEKYYYIARYEDMWIYKQIQKQRKRLFSLCQTYRATVDAISIP